jgi:shikimate dehydrogenase/3-dehydroquinate dehydratase type I
MICVSITDPTCQGAIRAIERSAVAADAIELRMDLIADGNVSQLLAVARRTSGCLKVIVTCRRPEESLMPAASGSAPKKKTLSKTAKMELLKEAISLGADFIDVELKEGERAIRALQVYRRRQKSSTGLIVSWHDITGTPSLPRLKEVFRACEQTQPEIIKIVTLAQNAEDNLKVLNLIPYARSRHQLIIAMCMGEAGKLSRAMAPLLGSYLGFAVLPGGRASAPGQLSIRSMRQIQELLNESIHPSPLLPGTFDVLNLVLLGNPIRHSLSPLMHNTALSAMKLAGQYSAFCVSDVQAAIAGIRGMNIRGASVTIPLKTEVMEYLDEIDPDALALGAVNTIVNDAGKLTGYNTDWLGLVQALKAKMTIAGKVFAILGAGGTARAAAYGILKEGGRPIIVNRTEDRGSALATRFDCPFYPLADVGKVSADVLINTTSVGLYPHVDSSPVDAAILAHYPCVADVIYNPLKTKLLRDAEAKGCKTISGLDMFVRQGALQLKLWTGKDAPLARMQKTVRERLKELES